jgi:hypothetical protein
MSFDTELAQLLRGYHVRVNAVLSQVRRDEVPLAKLLLGNLSPAESRNRLRTVGLCFA